jgi:type I restriction enzyme, S subunit
MKNVFFNEVVDFLEGPGVRNWQFTDSGIKLINIRNLVNDEINLTKTTTHLSIEEVTSKYSHFLLQEGDYVIASSGATWGKIAEVKKEHLPLCLNTSIIKLKPKYDNFEKKYLWYFIKSSVFTKQIDKIITGSAQPNFGPTHLKKIKIPLPSLETQKKIVQILDEASALRDKTKQLLKAYDILAQSIFLDMFGDPLKNEKSWEKIELSKLTEKVQKINKDYKYQTINYIDISSINNKKFRIESNSEFKIDERPSRAQQILKKDDVLMSTVRPNLKNIAMNKVDGLIASTGFYVCRVNNRLNSSYIFEVLKSESIINYFVGITSGANYPAVKSSDIAKLLVSLPPKILQNQFAEKITLIEKQKELGEQELKESQDLFNCLLQKAFKGELV